MSILDFLNEAKEALEGKSSINGSTILGVEILVDYKKIKKKFQVSAKSWVEDMDKLVIKFAKEAGVIPQNMNPRLEDGYHGGVVFSGEHGARVEVILDKASDNKLLKFMDTDEYQELNNKIYGEAKVESEVDVEDLVKQMKKSKPLNGVFGDSTVDGPFVNADKNLNYTIFLEDFASLDGKPTKTNIEAVDSFLNSNKEMFNLVDFSVTGEKHRIKIEIEVGNNSIKESIELNESIYQHSIIVRWNNGDLEGFAGTALSNAKRAKESAEAKANRKAKMIKKEFTILSDKEYAQLDSAQKKRLKRDWELSQRMDESSENPEFGVFTTEILLPVKDYGKDESAFDVVKEKTQDAIKELKNQMKRFYKTYPTGTIFWADYIKTHGKDIRGAQAYFKVTVEGTKVFIDEFKKQYLQLDYLPWNESNNMAESNKYHNIMSAREAYESAKLNIEMYFHFRLNKEGTNLAFYTPIETKKPILFQGTAGGGYKEVKHENDLPEDEWKQLEQYVKKNIKEDKSSDLHAKMKEINSEIEQLEKDKEKIEKQISALKLKKVDLVNKIRNLKEDAEQDIDAIPDEDFSQNEKAIAKELVAALSVFLFTAEDVIGHKFEDAQEAEEFIFSAFRALRTKESSVLKSMLNRFNRVGGERMADLFRRSLTKKM